MLPPPRLTATTLILLLAISALALATSLAPPVAGQSQGDVAPIHMNLKESDGFSPETWGDSTREAQREKPPSSGDDSLLVGCTKEWKRVGTWTADSTQFDLSLDGPVKFNMWWVVDDTTGCSTDLQFSWQLNVNGEEIASYDDRDAGDTYQCDGPDPCEWTGQVNSINLSHASKGSVFEVVIDYSAFDDIYIYYDNVTYDSGVTFKANAMVPLAGAIGGSSVSMEFAEAWRTNVKESLKGNYMTLQVDGTPVDNSKATDEKGETYEVNNASVTAQKVTWPIGGADPTVSFSYTKNESSYASPLMIAVSSLPSAGGSDGDGDGENGGLPGLGFGGAVAALAMAVAIITKKGKLKEKS